MTWWQQLIVNAVVALVAGGGLVGLLTLRQQRSKLGADTAGGMAVAAQTLTGSALELVQHAETRAARAEAKADHAEAQATEARDMAMLNQQRVSRLIQWIRTQGLQPPPWVEGLEND